MKNRLENSMIGDFAQWRKGKYVYSKLKSLISAEILKQQTFILRYTTEGRGKDKEMMMIAFITIIVV